MIADTWKETTAQMMAIARTMLGSKLKRLAMPLQTPSNQGFDEVMDF